MSGAAPGFTGRTIAPQNVGGIGARFCGALSTGSREGPRLCLEIRWSKSILSVFWAI